MKKYCIALIFLLLLISVEKTAQATILYKRYIVISDQGTDILCEPYRVRKNDYVFKLLKQKGEISYQDFPLFLNIFKRINPHITNINTILVNQKIMIPLRRIEKDAFPGQSSGIVDIPLIMISSITEMIDKHALTYTIQEGDTISKLISSQFGYDAYEEGVKLFEHINPHITDINTVFKGQVVKIPKAEIRQANWYASIFDDEGNIITPGSNNEEIHSPDLKTDTDKSEDLGESPLVCISKIFNAVLMNSGCYYFPSASFDSSSPQSVQIDLSKHPVMKFKNNYRFIFNSSDLITSSVKNQILSHWRNSIFSSLDTHNASFAQCMNEIKEQINLRFPEHNKNTDTVIQFRSPSGVHFSIQPDWIFNPIIKGRVSQKKMCISALASTKEQTDPYIASYLLNYNIELIEIINGGRIRISKSMPLKNVPVTDIHRNKPRVLIKKLCHLLGFQYLENVNINISVFDEFITTCVNLIEVDDGPDILIDFGTLYGNTQHILQSHQLKLLMINHTDTPSVIIEKLLLALNINYQGNPELAASSRTSKANISIQIPGIFIHAGDHHTNKIVLRHMIESEILHFLKNRNIDILI
ncbi:MAG: hypothetical protein CSA22_07320 [Deltaproteobacteria bacterium]|nr:MAG: hypothetical protein CSA22_07320 [Deltaproteobacteria bacterium]